MNIQTDGVTCDTAQIHCSPSRDMIDTIKSETTSELASGVIVTFSSKFTMMSRHYQPVDSLQFYCNTFGNRGLVRKLAVCSAVLTYLILILFCLTQDQNQWSFNVKNFDLGM